MNKKQALSVLKMNFKLLETLIEEGILACDSSGDIDPESFVCLEENFHFVFCLECGARVALLNGKHLKSCSGMTQAAYLEKHPGAAVLSGMSAAFKTKTEDQKRAQSEKLKARFQTPEGEVTRQQISEASKKMQASEYGEIAAEHLRTMTRSPEGRARISKQMFARYASGWNPVKDWHAANKEESKQRAFHARSFIQKKKSKPHLAFKAAMEEAGLLGFETECPVGYYHIDEARPDLKLSVEIDGCFWHGCVDCGFPGTPGIKKTDKRKTTFLLNRGWTILRFNVCVIKKDLAGCLDKVRQSVESLSQQKTTLKVRATICDIFGAHKEEVSNGTKP